MSSSPYILFDIPSGKAPSTTWTPNPWKTHLLFKFKGINYETKWIEYPDIKSTLENHVAPNPQGPLYSIPTIASPDGTYVMDSRKIADFIERQVPTPSLHLDSDVLAKVEALWSQYMRAIVPIFIPLVPKRILNEESIEYWYTTREKAVGMPLDELAKQGDLAWEKAEPVLREVTALLKENEGPFFLGETVSYADFVWGSIILFNERLGSEIFDEALKRSGDAQAHLNLLEAIRPWA